MRMEFELKDMSELDKITLIVSHANGFLNAEDIHKLIGMVKK